MKYSISLVRIGFLLLISLSTLFSFSQYVMTNGGSTTSCQGTFLDPGGTGNYSGGNSTWTHTVCGDVAGQPLYLTFTSFNLWSNDCVWGESVDELFIYDGPTTASPQIPGSPFSDGENPGNVLGTSGCLTFRFVREDNGGFLCAENDGSSGWEALISCTEFFPTGDICVNALPFCTAIQYNFPNSTNTTAESGPNYGCLLDQPNPTWYYMEIDQPGTIQIGLSQSTQPNGGGTGIDVDFALWGPYPSVGAGCQNILSGSVAPIQCSFSSSDTESIGIGVQGGTGSGQSTPPAAQTGQIYIVVLTNYDGAAGYIDFNQTGGTGSSDCSIVEPDPCLVTNFNVNITACNPDNTFNINGDFTYEDNPTSGTIIVEVDNGTSIYSTTINPPFAPGTVVPFTISNIPADGASSTITVYFSADVSCNSEITYTAPANCDCTADIGTFTATMTGVSATNYVLCFGDQISLETNDDWVAPEIALNPPGPPYVPGLSWLIYSCPPSVGLVPSAVEDVADDPCLLGVLSDFDFVDINDMFWINAFPAGTFTNNIVYFVPITMYNIDSSTYSFVNTTVGCYDLGQPYAVQYLPQITTVSNQSCTDGSLTVVVSGGLPQVNGSNFAIQAGAIIPPGASFVSSTTANGGSFVLQGLVNGDTYSFSIIDDNGCPVLIQGTFTGSENADFSYPNTVFCINDLNPTPTITGVAGGTFTSTPGLQLNPTTGVIDLINSTPGTYTVTYTTPTIACQGVSTFVVTLAPLPIVVAGVDQIVCEGTPVTLTATGANSYVWSNGVNNGTSFTQPIGVISYTVQGTSSAGCVNSDIVQVTVLSNPVISFQVDNASGCVPVTVTFTNSTPNSTSCVWNFGDGTSAVGCGTVTHTFTNEGCFDVNLTVTSNEGCTNSYTQQNMVCVYGYPNADFIANPYELSTMNSTTTFINQSTGATSYSWNFGDGSGQSNEVDPTHTFPIEEAGSYLVTLYAINQYGCRDTIQKSITVFEDLIFYVPNTFTPDGDQYNQEFKPVFTSGFDPFDYSLYIFNRWGELIFESHNTEVGWNGSYGALADIVQDGVYTWKIDFKTNRNDARKEVTGHVTIIR